MFSRLFASSKPAQPSDAKRLEDSLAQLQVNNRAASPTVTEPASIAASAVPGSPSRGGGTQIEAMRTPSPVRDGVEMGVNVETLRALVKGCPVKTVYDYVISQLDVASPTELRALSTFFAALTPPDQLHCVRCHKWFYEVENDDRGCTMAHDDESAEVEHIGYGNKRGGAYETRWDCCGRTVEGSGDLGPPSGWCYEGKHTVDRKRARYRNDSTPTNDLLQSCERRGCHRKCEARQSRSARVVIADDARSVRSTRSTETGGGDKDREKPASKKRGRKRKSQPEIHDTDEDDGKSIVTEAASVRASEPPESSNKRKKRKVAT